MMDVGLIGFGLAGRYFHAPVISAVPGLRLAAIVQRSGSEAALIYPHARIVRNVDELLAMRQIRLIVIATPNDTHVPLAQLCLEAGRNVVVDKPFAPTFHEAEALVKFGSEQKRLLTVYHNRRWDADFQAIHKLVSQGALGRIVLFETNYDRFRPNLKQNAWRERIGPGAGIFFDIGPHLIDQALQLFGTPEALHAELRIERDSGVVDDSFDVVMHYPRGLRAALRSSIMAVVSRPRFLLNGTRGSFRKELIDPLESMLRRGELPDGESWNVEREENWGLATFVQGEQLVQQRIPSQGDWRTFYAGVRDAILGLAPPPVTSREMLDVMRAIELAQESSRLRQTLPWPASNPRFP
ncbi:MAG: oxidoreductase [Candidatus Acidiferrum sp.]